jgi:hypothetical protein
MGILDGIKKIVSGGSSVELLTQANEKLIKDYMQKA